MDLRKRRFRRPDPLVVLAIVVAVGVAVTTL